MILKHTPVLLNECLKQAKDMKIPPTRYLDLTLGRGGHAIAFLESFPDMNLVGVDQDIQAISETKEKFTSLDLLSRSEFHHCNFHNWPSYAEKNKIQQNFDLILMDLGVSSPQLDDFERGFSFYKDGPLDMRMNQTQDLKAQDIINEYSEDDLNEIFRTLGEVRSPGYVTKAILTQREITPFTSTLSLAKLIESKEGWRKKGSHPATRYFLALRMAVNNEIDGLSESLPEIMNCLNEGGLLLVITFHSLEDRIVKYIFRDSEIGRPLTKKVIKPTDDEIKSNPRSRSALLRVFSKDSLNNVSNKIKGVKNEKRNKYK